MAQVLFIDDDTEVLEINKKYLDNEGFETLTASSAAEGIKLIETTRPDCIVLDIMMPDMNGFQACNRIREITDAPIIFLTGKTAEEDKIKGLLLGADDYMIKPYSLKELHARILAHIRRNQTKVPSSSNILSFPPMSIDKVAHKVYYLDKDLKVTAREYELLLFLAKRPNVVITYEDIAMYVWGNYSDNDRRTIMVQMSRLRKKLAAYEGLESMIETVWSQGYKFVPN